MRIVHDMCTLSSIYIDGSKAESAAAINTEEITV